MAVYLGFQLYSISKAGLAGCHFNLLLFSLGIWIENIILKGTMQRNDH